MDALTQTAATLGMSIISLQAGMALAEFLKFEIILTIVDPRRWIRRDLNRSLDSSRITESHSVTEVDISNDSKSFPNTSSLIIISLGPIFWIASAFLCGFKPSFRKVTFSILFSPPGAISRWYLSRFNNSSRSKRFPFFPLGTLSANLLATLLISILFLCQNFGGGGESIGSTRLTCQVLYGLQEGFCGCLSTISTFAVELTKLKPKKKAVGYAFSSWFLGILICVLVIGIPWWTKGMDGSCKGIIL
jgi:fluoride exporter